MEKPKIVDKFFSPQDLKPGTYYWCSCGKSSNQPFCDSTHKGSSFQPVEFKVEQEQRVKLCLCKHTKKPPYCDGTHGAL